MVKNFIQRQVINMSIKDVTVKNIAQIDRKNINAWCVERSDDGKPTKCCKTQLLKDVIKLKA